MPTILPTIHFDKEGKTYVPGDMVTGVVRFDLPQPLSARSIMIGSSGKTETWNITTFEPNCKKRIFNGVETVWVSEDGKNQLIGPHEFPFSFALPAECPPTFKGLYGQNKYKVTVFVDTPWKMTIRKVKEEFTVNTYLDLPEKMFPNPDKMTSWFYRSVLQAGLVFKEGPVTLKVSMPSLVYKGGDTVILDFNVINKSAVPIKNICAKLCERTHFHARNQHTPCKEFTFHTCPLGYFGQEYTCRKIGSVCTKRVDIPPYSTQSVTLAVTIPDTVKTPSFESGLISHGYLFELGVQAQGSWFAQYMTAKIYIGDKKGDEMEDEDEPKVTMKEMLLQNAPPPAYTP